MPGLTFIYIYECQVPIVTLIFMSQSYIQVYKITLQSHPPE